MCIVCSIVILTFTNQERSVEFREVNEDYTSKLCSKCNEVLEPIRGKHNETDRRGTPLSHNELCMRDIGMSTLARNIFVVSNDNSHGGQRPEKFTRTYQQDTLRIRQIRS